MKDVEVTWEQVEQVRKRTLIGMYNARQALFATGGNVEEAVELINNYYYNFDDWDLKYKLMKLEKGIKALEEWVKGKNNG